MPVIIASEEIHPFLPSLASGAAIERERAAKQDIRPMEFVILNLMADKVATERQLALWLGNTTLQVRLTFAATDSYVQGIANGRDSKNTPVEHIRKFYKAWSDIRHRKFDGLIVTGVNALQPRVSDEAIWGEVTQILDWSTTNVLSSLFLCWGAQAALKHFHDVESIKGDQKIFGLFDHQGLADKAGLLFGFPDVFPVPVSRWRTPDPVALAAHPEIEHVAISDEGGTNILAETAPYDEGLFYPKRLYVLNHPEYEAGTLKGEYMRDSAANPATPLPRHYFPGDDPAREPLNSWRHTAHLYTNWVKSIYEATPYDLDEVPRPFRASSLSLQAKAIAS
ncbi:MAG: homoserine O-succinyltransferase [Alphaproteobacteria bacterium]|nr:homoserine O-succinyltransferase [Alphaproteobacteria bacterium]